MAAKLNSIERDAQVMALCETLTEIEQRLIPTGLHVFGRAAELQEKADLLRMVASFDRPEDGVRALPALVADALGIDRYDELLRETPTSETRDIGDGIVSEAIQQFCEGGADTAAAWLNLKVGVVSEKSSPTFSMLARIAEQLDSN